MTYNDKKNMFCRVIYVYRQNDRKTKNDRIYTINKDFNVAQIRYKLCRTTCDTTANSTVSNEQQAVRGISVITPLPTGEGTGEGPVCAFIFVDRMTEWANLLYLLGVLNSLMLVNCWLTNEAVIITSTSSIYATSLFRLRLPSSKRR